MITLPEISEEAQKIRLNLERESLDDTPIPEKRRIWEEYARSVKAIETVHTENIEVVGVPCMLHTPQVSGCSSEVIAYIHGGGLVEGSAVTCREWCSRLALAAKQSVLAIDYRLAPECPYPAAIEDVVAVFGSQQEISDSCVISSMGADSTGSVLALRSMIILRDRGSTLPESCFLLSPSIDLSFSGTSMKTNSENDPLVSKEVLEHYANLYAGGNSLSSPEISPLFADLRGLPPILVHVDSDELLLDDAKRVVAIVGESGGSIRLIQSHGLWHTWPAWCDFPEANLATEQIVEHIHMNKRDFCT